MLLNSPGVALNDQKSDSMILMIAFQLGISDDFNECHPGIPAIPPPQLESCQTINHLYQQPNRGQLDFTWKKKKKNKATSSNSAFHSIPSRALQGCQHRGGHPALCTFCTMLRHCTTEGAFPGKSVVSLPCIVRGKARLGGFLVILLGEVKLSCSVSAAPAQEVGCLQCVLDMCYHM